MQRDEPVLLFRPRGTYGQQFRLKSVSITLCVNSMDEVWMCINL